MRQVRWSPPADTLLLHFQLIQLEAYSSGDRACLAREERGMRVEEVSAEKTGVEVGGEAQVSVSVWRRRSVGGARMRDGWVRLRLRVVGGG